MLLISEYFCIVWSFSQWCTLVQLKLLSRFLCKSFWGHIFLGTLSKYLRKKIAGVLGNSMFIDTGIPFLKAMVLFYTLTIIYENSAFFEFSPRLICLLMALCWVHSSADNLEFLSTYFLYQKETSHSTHIKLSIKTFNRRLQLLVYKFVSSPRITTVDRGHIYFCTSI